MITKRLKALKRKHPRYAKLLFFVSPLVIYVFFTLLYFGPRHISELSHAIFSIGGDPEQVVWFLNWWVFSVGHHINPLISHYVFYPEGFNMAWSTASPFASIMTAPLILIFGAQVAYNLLALAAPVLAAFSAFLLAYYVTRKYLPSLIAGYIYGFSSYMLCNILAGHLNLGLIFLLPLLILVFLMRLRGRIGQKRFIGLATLGLVAQFLLSTEIFATFLFFAFGTAALFWMVEKQLRIKLQKVVIESGIAIGCSIIVLAPYIYYLIKGYAVATKSLFPNLASLYSGDLLNFVLPTRLTQIGHTHFALTTSHFTGNYYEQSSYLGIPFLVIVVWIAATSKHKNHLKLLLVVLALLMICTLGAMLRINGLDQHVVLPWAIIDHLPLLKSAIPNRFTMFMFLALALVVGIWLSAKSSAKITRLKYIIVLIALMAILPNTSIFKWGTPIVPTIFQKNQVNHYIPKGSNVITLPYENLGHGMYYQYASGMHFNQVGGYIGIIPYTFYNDPAVQVFQSNILVNDFKARLEHFCKQHDVSQIIYAPDTGANIISQLNSLGWNTKTVGDQTIIYVPL